METKGFQFEIILMCQLALYPSFEYLCYGSTAIRNFKFFQPWTVFICQNLTSTVSDSDI